MKILKEVLALSSVLVGVIILLIINSHYISPVYRASNVADLQLYQNYYAIWHQ